MGSLRQTVMPVRRLSRSMGGATKGSRGLQNASFGYNGNMCPRHPGKKAAMPDPTAQWYRRARVACEPFMFAEARYRTPWVDDELAEVVRTARQWLRDHPCPDYALGQNFVGMLDAYNEMTSATVSRVMELRSIIERYVHALDKWKPPSSRSAPTAGVDPVSWKPHERQDGERVSAQTP